MLKIEKLLYSCEHGGPGGTWGDRGGDRGTGGAWGLLSLSQYSMAAVKNNKNKFFDRTFNNRKDFK